MSARHWIKKNFTPWQFFLSIVALIIFVSVAPLVLIVQHVLNKKEATIKSYEQKFIIQKFKTIEKNDSAIKLEELCSKLGIDIVPKRSKGVRPSEELQKKIKEINKVIIIYLRDELSKENASIDDFRDEILQFYLSNISNIESIVNFLSANPQPEWALQPTDGFLPLPNVLGHYTLQRLLALDVLHKISTNATVKAKLSFNAMVNLNQSFLRRPELLSQVIGLSIVRLHVGLIRKMPWLLTDSELVVLNQAYRKAYFDALHFDAVKTGLYILGDESLKKVFPKWYLDLAASDLVETNLRRIKILESIDSCVDLPNEIKSIRYAVWNKFADYKKKEWWEDYVHTLVDIDFTSSIVWLKEYKNANRNWPQSFHRINGLRCRNASFGYEVTENSAIISIHVPILKEEDKKILSRKFYLQSTEKLLN